VLAQAVWLGLVPGNADSVICSTVDIRGIKHDSMGHDQSHFPYPLTTDQPTGFKPYGAKTCAVRSHPFGLDLSEQDRKALIAFLKTL
jgi:hypothetical protein